MLHPDVIKGFLNRKLYDFNWLKDVPDADLDQVLSDLPVDFEERGKLDRHQKVCIVAGIDFPQLYFMLDMGLGKSRVCLELFRYWFKIGKVRRAVVVVPTNEVSDSWERQLGLWAPELPYLILKEGGSRDKLAAYQDFQYGIVVVIYPSLVWMGSSLKIAEGRDGEVKRTKGGQIKRKVTPDKKQVRLITENVQALVLDEITKVKNQNSVSYRVCRQLSRNSDIHYALAGRPFGRNPMDLWPQFYLVDGGETLGPTLGLFREVFFTQKKRFFGGPHSFEYKFRTDMQDDLHRIIQHRAIHYSEDECLDLPPIEPIPRYVDFPAEPQAYYKEMVRQIRQARGDIKTVENIFLRMRQLSSGFLGFRGEEDGEKAEMAFDENPKLEALMELVDEMPRDRKAVIVHEFTYSGRLISERLKEAGIRHGWIWGGVKDSKPLVTRFMEDPREQVLLLNHKKGAYGIDGLQVANYMFVYESPVSVIDRDQLEHRLKRRGQKQSRVYIYDLIVRGSADQTIRDNHATGGNLFAAIVKNPSLLR